MRRVWMRLLYDLRDSDNPTFEYEEQVTDSLVAPDGTVGKMSPWGFLETSGGWTLSNRRNRD